MLVYGNGRSYGDVCLTDDHILLGRGLDRFIALDAKRGILRAEAGVLLSEILDIIVPKGWFLPVTPGTRFVTLGGAVANDVHGKNHHRAGTFGHHIKALELVRSDGSRRVCTPTENSEWFAVTIGGMGLTGLITWVEIQLSRIAGPWIQGRSQRFRNIQEFLMLSEACDSKHEFTVAWVDCGASENDLGRGILLSGDFAPASVRGGKRPAARALVHVPFASPASLINRFSSKAFNAIYYRKPLGEFLTHYERFFYPLDAVGNWNRLYGPKGFQQYQCVLPPGTAEQALGELLAQVARCGQASFLAVLKRFGNKPPVGTLSFPRPGITLALDFPMAGAKTLSLLGELDKVVAAAGGALYPAKDARMGADMYRHSFPNLINSSAFFDPGFSSLFRRRAVQV